MRFLLLRVLCPSKHAHVSEVIFTTYTLHNEKHRVYISIWKSTSPTWPYFRRQSGKSSRVRAAKDLLNSGQEMDSAGMTEGLLAIDVACVLKEYLKGLPTPLLSSRKDEIVAAMAVRWDSICQEQI